MNFRFALVALFLLALQNPKPIANPPQRAPQIPPQINNPAQPDQTHVTFVQLTDAHIFDDGWKENGSEPYWHALDDRTALHWAVEQINMLAASGTQIDFVVYTGDFGLENVFFAEPDCTGVPFKSEPGLPPFASKTAVNELALEFNRLSVPNVYVVPGNNDIISEQVVDAKRFDCFITELQATLRSMPNHIQLKGLRPDEAERAGAVRLAGLNTASFKRAKENYADACLGRAPSARLLLRRACPAPQMKALGKLLDANDAPLLVFTHIPDLIDPYEKDRDASRSISAWDIDDATRNEWSTQASKRQLLGIFAGHFHWYRKEIYATTSGTRYLFVNAGIGAKTWVAPPLAGKNQRDRDSQARGFMLVNIDLGSGNGTVAATPVWYPGRVTTSTGPATPPIKEGGISMSSVSFFSLLIAVILITGCYGGILNYLLNKRDNPDDPGLWRNLVLGVGAAALVPLFLKLIGSDVASGMASSASGDHDYSKVLEFGGFCLIAAMSGKTFIRSLSDRALQKVENIEKIAGQAKDQAAQAYSVVERLVEPQEPQSETKPLRTDQQLSEEESKILTALSNQKYVLRTSNGVAVEARIERYRSDEILKNLQAKGLADTTIFAGADRQKRAYWYITDEGRAMFLSSKEKSPPG